VNESPSIPEEAVNSYINVHPLLLDKGKLLTLFGALFTHNVL